MSGFLTFLSNNYIYFLIAAGVLAFALVGFLVDIKKKKDAEAAENFSNSASIPNVAVPNEIPNVAEENVPVGIPSNEASFNPAPPMPEQPVDIPNDNSVNEMPVDNSMNQPVENIQSDQINNQINQ